MKFAFVAPSGAGKTTVINIILQKFPNFFLSKSYTTRTKRNINDNEYHFVNEDEFLMLKQQNFFLENEKIFSHWYGTPKITNQDVIFNVDIKGLKNLKEHFKDLISIGLVVPINSIHQRLKLRGEENISERIQRYTFEVSHMHELDFLIVNDELDTTIQFVENIIDLYTHKKQAIEILN